MPPKYVNEKRDVERKVSATHPAAQHLVQDDTESPEVSLKAVFIAKEDFRGQ